MPEIVVRNQQVQWLTVRIERTADDAELERFFFATADDIQYYVDLRPSNRASELVAVSLARDAFLHGKNLNIWYEERAGRRWVKALNIWG